MKEGNFKSALKGLLKDEVPKELLEYLPSGFQQIGDIIVIKLPEQVRMYADEIGDAALRHCKARAVCARGPVTGSLREPEIRVIAGEGTETTHTENGCLYRLDVAKVMFAKGNIKERGRLAGLAKPRESVIDMFAGIGYFSIPMAKACPDCRLTAIDMNPASIRYLEENCRLNKVANIKTVRDDCRLVALRMKDKADRIVMGYLPGTSAYLQAALEMLKPRGVIHFHDVFTEAELWDTPLELLRTAARAAGYRLVKTEHKRKVKQYAPRRWHVVIDASFEKLKNGASCLLDRSLRAGTPWTPFSGLSP
jgi:tRNA wybutosine-synthesizing protein 2